MRNYTFQNGDFIITLTNQKSMAPARQKLAELIRILAGQVAFDSVPKATDFDLIDVQRVAE
jgi:hypothetical protein